MTERELQARYTEEAQGSERSLQAAGSQISDSAFAELVKENRQFLLSCASRAVRHFVTEQDDEWSVALQAFHEAVTGYDASRGDFKVYVSVVVRRRLTDWMRSVYRHAEEEVQEIPETIPAEEDWPGRYTIRDEIEAVRGELAEYGFSFFDLAEASPKAQKTRKKCAAAAAALLQSDELIQRMETTKTLPVKELSRMSGVSGKVIEKHRRYLIAAAVILRGEYPLLAEYLHMVREEMIE